MQQAHESLTPRRADDEPRSSSGLPPVKTFLVLVLIVIAVLAAAVATRPATAPPLSKAPRAKPDYSLTNEEAIARFEELHKLFRQASMRRDVSLLPAMLTPESKLHAFARKEINQLRRDNVLDRSVLKTEAVRVVENSPDEIRLEQMTLLRPRFIDDATGVSVGTSGPVRERVKWTLRLDGTVWKVHDVLVVEREPIKR